MTPPKKPDASVAETTTTRTISTSTDAPTATHTTPQDEGLVGGLKLLPARLAMGQPGRTGVQRWSMLAYGIACYLIFFATFAYAVGFLGGFVVPTTLSMSEPGTARAALINCALLAIFAIQHSVMARPAFKRLWTKIVPQPAERSTYVLFSSIALIALFACWQPMGEVIWSIDATPGKALAYTGFAFGWLLVFASTCLISHFDLFGLRQVWLAFNDRPYEELAFVTPWPYRVIRHPLYLGWLFAMWCTPYMTVSHALFAALGTVYIFIGITLEERDLKQAHPDYADYARAVPMIIPRLFSRPAALPLAAA